MTETTTEDRTDEATENLVDAAARAAQEAGAKTLAAIEPDQVRFNSDQIAILRQLGIEDATDGDLNLFFHVCRTTGLDPFRKQIYMIGRNTKVTEWVEDERAQNGRRKVEKWVTKYTIQTGIDGYRRNGREAAKMLGDELAFDGPYFCGEDGEWKDVWLSKSAPLAAKFTIFRNGEPFTGIAHFDEFVQTNNIYEGYGKDKKVVGEEPNSMWRKMPRNQIAKCAEALAWRRAYPDDFSGLILEDAALPTVIDQDGNVESGPAEPEKRRPAGGSGINAVRAERERRQAKRREPVIDAEVIPDEPASDSGAKPEPEQVTDPAPAEESELRKSVRQTNNGAIFAIFSELGMNGKSDEDRADRLVVVHAIVEREVESTKDLTDDELQKLRNGLVSRKQGGTLEADVTEWLNIAAIKADQAAQAAEEAAATKQAES